MPSGLAGWRAALGTEVMHPLRLEQWYLSRRAAANAARTADSAAAAVEGVGIDSGGREIVVAQKHPHQTDVVADHEQVGREALPRGISARANRERAAVEILLQRAEQAPELFVPIHPA